jgi:hypothetical protein
VLPPLQQQVINQAGRICLHLLPPPVEQHICCTRLDLRTTKEAKQRDDRQYGHTTNVSR